MVTTGTCRASLSSGVTSVQGPWKCPKGRARTAREEVTSPPPVLPAPQRTPEDSGRARPGHLAATFRLGCCGLRCARGQPFTWLDAAHGEVALDSPVSLYLHALLARDAHAHVCHLDHADVIGSVPWKESGRKRRWRGGASRGPRWAGPGRGEAGSAPGPAELGPGDRHGARATAPPPLVSSTCQQRPNTLWLYGCSLVQSPAERPAPVTCRAIGHAAQLGPSPCFPRRRVPPTQAEPLRGDPRDRLVSQAADKVLSLPGAGDSAQHLRGEASRLSLSLSDRDPFWKRAEGPTPRSDKFQTRRCAGGAAPHVGTDCLPPVTCCSGFWAQGG